MPLAWASAATIAPSRSATRCGPAGRRLESSWARRSRAGASVTPAGEALLAETEGVLGAVRQAERAAKAAGGVVATRLRVGAFPSAAAGLVPGAVREARRRHPHAEVELDLRVMESDPALR